MLYIIETENEVNRQGVSTILATSVHSMQLISTSHMLQKNLNE